MCYCSIRLAWITIPIINDISDNYLIITGSLSTARTKNWSSSFLTGNSSVSEYIQSKINFKEVSLNVWYQLILILASAISGILYPVHLLKKSEFHSERAIVLNGWCFSWFYDMIQFSCFVSFVSFVCLFSFFVLFLPRLTGHCSKTVFSCTSNWFCQIFCF